MTKTCPTCGIEFDCELARQIYCCDRCGADARLARRRAVRAAKIVGERGFSPYTAEELMYRPVEHIIDVLSLRQIAGALGISTDTAAVMKASPWTLTDTENEITPEKDYILRQWLSEQILDKTEKVC